MKSTSSCNLWLQTYFFFFCTLWWARTQPSTHTFKMSFGSSYKTANYKNPLKNPEEPILNMSKAELSISFHKLGSSSRFLVCGEGTFVDTMSQMPKCENCPKASPPLKPRSSYLSPCHWSHSCMISYCGFLSYQLLLSLLFCFHNPPLFSQASPLPTFTPATAFLLVSLGFGRLLCWFILTTLESSF